MTDNYLCIHGHFYQPPRENPWLGAIEYQASAWPYHDWNQRITRECYGPNTRARVHGRDGQILKLINNYEYMSFNFGPTLLSWLENAHVWIYDQILAADRASMIRYHGHGNAMAQVYNHIIMPMARGRDKLTQIRWGMADFKHRFGRQAEGMWLAETAVDTKTLKLMANEGVKFTILSPSQARSVRPLAGKAHTRSWQDVSGGKIDPTRPYRVLLGKSGRLFIDVFFYEGPISRAVAYEKILASGENFLARIKQVFEGRQDGPRLVSVATDGESYGHHFKFGDLALAWLFYHLENTGEIKLTNYGSFLERFPPEHEVRLFENSSWSCSHGIERWRSDCGCNVSRPPEWNQAWRGPLREGLEWLADELAALFEERGGQLFKDPWKARDDYVTVLLDRSDYQRDLFMRNHAKKRSLGAETKVEAFKLLESQRMALYMFTSCGWFFDDISGLEAVQVLKYAARALDLVQPWAGKRLEKKLIDFLGSARSNVPEHGDGGRIYQALVAPSRIDPSLAAAHYALESLVDEIPQEPSLFYEMVQPISERRSQGQGIHAILGEVQVKETGTGQDFGLTYVAFRRDGKDLGCLVGKRDPSIDLDKVAKEVWFALTERRAEKIEEVFYRHLSAFKSYGPKDMIPDTRRYIVEGLARRLDRLIKNYIREQNGFLQGLLSLLEETGDSGPGILGNIVELMVSDELARLMVLHKEGHALDSAELRRLAAKAMPLGVSLDGPILGEKARDFLRRQMEGLFLAPDLVYVENVTSFLNLAEELKLNLDLWECQNMFYDLYHDSKITQSFSPALFSAFQEMGQRLGFVLGGE